MSPAGRSGPSPAVTTVKSRPVTTKRSSAITIAGHIDKSCTGVEPTGQLGEGEVLAKEDPPLGVGRHEVEQLPPGREPENVIAPQLLA
jgi:hypothetical protein